MVLYCHNCPKCREAIPRYEELAHYSVANPKVPQVVMIEVPPYGDRDSLPLGPHTQCILGRLSDVKDWFVDGPVEVVCNHGVVVKVEGRETD